MMATPPGVGTEPASPPVALGVVSIRFVPTPLSRRIRCGTVLAVTALVSVSGCAGQGNVEAATVEATASTFVESVSTAAAKACGLLAPETLRSLEESEGGCAEALPSSAGVEGSASVESVQVYGKDAIVRLSTDTIFLARFPQGWRVTAAGCTRQQDGRPYDCKVKGA